MAIAIICPGCKGRLVVPESLAGRKLRCKACHATAEVPALPRPAEGIQPAGPEQAGTPVACTVAKPPPAALPKRRKKNTGQQRSEHWKWIALGGSVVAALVVVGILIVWLASSLGRWEDFVSKEAHFRVSTPRKLMEQTPAQVKNLEQSARMYVTEGSEDEGFMVAFAIIPKQRLESTSVSRILHDSCEGAMRNARGGTERYRQRIRRGPFDGVELVIDVEVKGTTKGSAVMQGYLVNGRSYVLLAVGPNISPDSGRVRRFFESFSVTDEPAFKGAIRPVGPQRKQSRPGPPLTPAINEMQLLTQLEPMTSAVFAPSRKGLFTLTVAGELLHYTYPGFELAGRHRLASCAHRSILDEANGLLCVATYRTPPGNVHPHDLARMVGAGDVQIYDLQPILKNPRANDPFKPSATITVGGTITHLALAKDGKQLFYLDVKDPAKAHIGVIDTAAGRQSRTIAVAPNTEMICLAPDGNRLFAAATLCGHKYLHPPGTKLEGLLQIIDPASGRTTHAFKVDQDPFDMAVTADNRVIITGGSNQHTSVTLVDLNDEGGPVIEGVGGIYMNTYVRASADGKRLFLSETGLSPASTRIWDMEALARLEAKESGVATRSNQAAVGGDFYLSPDSKCLICRSGAVYWVTKAEPMPRVGLVKK
jgi:hypothetical protein